VSDYDTKYGAGRNWIRNVGGGKNPNEISADVNMNNIHNNFPPYWLYPDPDTFSRDGPPTSLQEELISLKTILEEFPGRVPSFLTKGLTDYERKYAFTTKPSNSTHLVDIGSRPKGRETNSQSKLHTFISPEDLAKHLRLQRRREDAKKRFIHINACSPQEAVVLYIGSPRSEGYSTMAFIDKYCSGTNWVKDDVFKDANLWVSELHLSYFVLAPEGRIVSQDPKDSLHGSLQRSRWSFASKRHGVSHTLRRAATSFRFVGDAHDRWWTCYTLSYTPGSDESFNLDQFAYKDRGDQKKRHSEDLHGQRRFIELVLLENITKDMVSSTQSILQLIDKTLDQGESAGNGDDNDIDASDREFDQKSHALSAEYVQFSKLLRIVQDNHRRVAETINEWDQRERQRKHQPRWSYDDEREYRKPLDLKTRELKRNIAKIKEQGDEIVWKIGDLKDLRTILSADLSLREARVSTQSSEDVRLFTYVTVIFLPLTFSSSLFSMQGLPNNLVVTTFIILTICALFITLLVLINLKTLNRIRGRASAKLFAKARRKMHESLRIFWNRMGRDLDSVEEQTIHPNGPSISKRKGPKLGDSSYQSRPMVVEKPVSHQSKWWYLHFWLSDLFLEAPARRVDLAWQAFSLSEKKRKRLGHLRVAMRIIIGLLWLPVLIPSHILWLAIINLLELPLLLYWQLSHGFKAFMEWLDEEPSSEPDDVSELTQLRKNVTVDQGSSTSVDRREKRAAEKITVRGREQSNILVPNAKRIQGFSEPWKLSRAHPNWFGSKKSATASESMANRKNGEPESPAENQSSKEHHRGIWSSVFKSLSSLLPSGRRKGSQPRETKDGQTVV
jgi:Mg2+ and Co2+ transporter CorA